MPHINQPETRKIDRLKLRYQVEFGSLMVVVGVFSLLAMERASNLGSFLARKIGPRLGSNKRALRHLKMALPDLPEEDYKFILDGMWDNLGRVLAEYSDLEYFVDDLELAGVEHIKRTIATRGQAILFSGHIGNWELMAPTLLRHGMPVDLVYRAPNNPYVEKLLARYRSLKGKLRLLPKSHAGTRQLVESIKEGRSVGILIDQKYNEGIEVPFFGQPAMTSPAFVQLGQKYDVPLVPFRVERLEGTRFRLTFYPPLKTLDDSGNPRPVEDVIADAHRLLESWITDRPDQWLWLHKRWKES